jgi:hypothetical protein
MREPVRKWHVLTPDVRENIMRGSGDTIPNYCRDLCMVSPEPHGVPGTPGTLYLIIVVSYVWCPRNPAIRYLVRLP